MKNSEVLGEKLSHLSVKEREEVTSLSRNLHHCFQTHHADKTITHDVDVGDAALSL